MSSDPELPLENSITQSPREICESPNKNELHDDLGTKSTSKGIDNDHNPSIQGIKNQDYCSADVQSSEDSNRGTREDYSGSSMQDHNHGNEGEQSPVCSSCGRMQDLVTLETGKLAKAASDGASAAKSEKSKEFADKVQHFRSHSILVATSQGNSKWPSVSTDRIIRLPSKRANVGEAFDPDKVDIDTNSPIDSVKSAVSKFGGILDWKAHKDQTLERTKVIDEEIEKVQEEIPLYKEQAEVAEQSKVQTLSELENTKRLIEELKLSLERAETEESQAQQDRLIAKLRLEELETGVADEACVASKSELEMAKNRHKAAVTDLKVVKEELESLQKEYAASLIEKDIAVKEAEVAVSESKGMEKTVETLTVELVSTKETLESVNVAHFEAEEDRNDALMAKEQDLYAWEKELKEAQENLVCLNEQIESSKELKAKLSIESSRLEDLKAELATYTDPKISEYGETSGDETHAGVTMAMNTELDDVKRRMDKASDEVNCLRMASISLKAELEKEESELIQLRQREGMGYISVASLEAEVDKIMSEIGVVRNREKEARDRMEDLPRQLQHASKETEEAKSEAELAHQRMKIAKEEADIAKTGAKTTESRLIAAVKEIEATRASERLALEVIKTLQLSESMKKTSDEDSNDKVRLTLEEYHDLSKRAHEAEQANTKVSEAKSNLEEAKEDELRSMKQLEDAIKEMDERKEALRVAQEKAEKAEEGKLSVEQELRKMKSEHEQQRKAGENRQRSNDSPTIGVSSVYESLSLREDNGSSPKGGLFGRSKTTKKKKKSLFPRLFMFLGRMRRKSSSPMSQ